MSKTLSGESIAQKRVVAFVAHPGHELRIFRAMELAKPVLHVLTDGSGSTGVARTDSTTRILEATGARPGSVYGRYRDADVYAAVLGADTAFFETLVNEYAESIFAEEAEVVIGDMQEGYNSSHDICRIMIGAAVARCREKGLDIENLDFPLMGLPGRYGSAEGALRIDLSDEDFAKKLRAAENYPELKREVDAAIGQVGTEPFKMEVLRPVADQEGLNWPGDEPPYYETYGEKQVAAGHYKHVIRYKEHIQPIAQALHRVLTPA